MPSTTSLLKSAASTKKKVRNLEDSFAAFEWESSAQTYDDFVAYNDYLTKRQNSATDSSEALSYSRTIRSAQRSYVSNELQRQQQAILEGRGTTQDKLDAVKGLYYQAVDNQDFNLAQNLISQWDSLSIKLQNENEASASKFASASTKEFDKLVKSLTKGTEDVTLPTGETVSPLAAIAADMEQTGGGNYTWSTAQETMQALAGLVMDRYNNATTQEEVDKLEEKYGVGLQDLNSELTFDVGGQKLSYQDTVNAQANEEFNNPLFGLEAKYNEATGETTYELKKNNIDRIDYVRQVNPQTGVEEFVPAMIRTNQPDVYFGFSDQTRDLNTQITDTGSVIGGNVNPQGQGAAGMVEAGARKVNRDESQSIKNRLANLGIIAKQNGTTLTVRLPGENVDRVATIQPDGSLRYFDEQGQINEIGLVDRNLGTDALPQLVPAGQPRVVSPEEVSDFATQSAFGGELSQTSGQGQRYVQDILGQAKTPTSLDGKEIRVGNDFSGFGTAVTSNLLQGAAQTRQVLKLQQEKQAMLQAQQERLQASQTFNLNQVPVQQLTSQGILKKQLQVAAPRPTPRVVVAPPPPPQRITSVNVAAPTSRVSGVTQLPSQPRVRVY